MSEEFEFAQMSMAGGYAGLYRAGNEPFNVLLGKDGRPALFESSLQAIRAAKDHVAVKATPAPMAVDHDVLGVDQWRKQKASVYAEGQLVRKTKSFQPFVVERKKGKKIVRPQV